jgi:spore germination protein YaaH
MIHTPTFPRRSDRRGGIDLVVVLAVGFALLAGACDAASPSGSTPATTNAPAVSAGSTVGGADSSGGGGGGSTASPSGAAPSAPSSAGASASPAQAGDYDPVKFGFAAKGLRGEVMAFVTTSQVDDALARLDFDATSTIAFFSLVAGSNGSINHDTRWRSWNGALVDQLIARAHASGTKVVISLARFSWSASQTKISATLLASVKARARLARVVSGEVVRRGVDGVNVDFEPIPRGQKANFTDLVRRIRTELDARGPGYQLTFDVVGHFESYDVGTALELGGADAVYLMGYHYAGTFSTIAHGTAPLGGPRYSVADAIRGLRAFARPSQLIVGVPYYGHLWPTVSGALNARTTARGYDVLYSSARLIARRRGATYDPVEQVQRVAWRGRSCAACPLHWFQLYYDDARSLGVKWAEFRRQGLLGTGVWTTAFEGDSGELAGALREAWLVGG